MEPIVLNGTPREGTGKESNRKLRGNGGMPAVLYGHGLDSSLNVTLEPRQLAKALENPKKANALMNVELGSDSDTHTVLVREIQRHPVSRNILHVDLVVPDLDKPVQSTVPVRFVGRSIGVSMGGRLRTPYREVNVICKPALIPVEIVVDISELNIGKSIQASQLDVPENVSVVYDRDFVVVKVLKPRGGGDATADDASSTEESSDAE